MTGGVGLLGVWVSGCLALHCVSGWLVHYMDTLPAMLPVMPLCSVCMPWR